MKKPSTLRDWNRYCAWVALTTGNLAGIVFVLPALSMALGGPPWSGVWHRNFQWAGDLLNIIAINLLWRTPRQMWPWALVTPSLWLAWSVADRVVAGNWPGLASDLQGNVIAALLYLIFGGILALALGAFGRGRVAEAAPAVTPPGPQETEGVWPPPPRRPE